MALLEELCDTMINGSLCGLGGMTRLSGPERPEYFRADFPKQTRKSHFRLRFSAAREGCPKIHIMYSTDHRDSGTPRVDASKYRHARYRRGFPVTVPQKARPSCGPPRWLAVKFRNFVPPTRSRHLALAGCVCVDD